MFAFRSIAGSTLAILATIVVAACAQHAATLPAAPLSSAYAAESLISPATDPPKCKHQKDTKKRASLTVKIARAGGSFCVPEFGGFGGSIEYPKANRADELTIRTSTSNIYNELLLGSGTPIVYLNLHFHSNTIFGGHVRSSGGLESAQIDAGQPYTAYGIVAVGHLDLMFPPCYSTATSGAYGGVLPDLGGILRNITITGNGYGVIEIYPGEQVTSQC
jgi:hypothetical protein